MNAARIWSVLFLIASAGLGLLVAGDLARPTAVPAGPARPAGAPPAAVTVDRTDPPAPRALEEFSAISERPLFSRSRRPEAPASAGPTGGRTPDGLILMGTVIGRDRKAALLQVPGERTLQTVVEGEAIAGWTLQKVLPDRVILTDGGDTAEISIWENHRRPPAETARKRRPDRKTATRPRRPGAPEPGRPDSTKTDANPLTPTAPEKQ